MAQNHNTIIALIWQWRHALNKVATNSYRKGYFKHEKVRRRAQYEKKGTKHKKASLMSFLTYGSTLTTYLAITVTGGFLLFDTATMQPKKFQEILQIRSSNISLYIKVLSKN